MTGPATPVACGVRGLCPRCGKATLFAGLLAFAPRCSACGLDFAAFNVGDGPAAFLTLGIGTIVTVAAIWLELAVAPPWWVHALLWMPLTIGGVVGSLRVAKGVLLALEYSRDAREGRGGR
ncbi:hypothetical protein ASG37_09505 [Sphingomonas sp. Leaf407]|uniref:DUF983 domain-containing protein n=1 Tax=unclassified Sphingomonas TaxID=196159 RepID=UPI0006F2590B|nr:MULTISPECIES: DUF983 domain-containing protein [unclassified Sphingomonas]KQN37301.1 hypothetical protein ASE97_06795 [Sphingomonas sp. Leaf42]KQT27669.1 hypothetical protein ASG37_09505 [Sphingomonas sp. Leaf407]